MMEKSKIPEMTRDLMASVWERVLGKESLDHLADQYGSATLSRVARIMEAREKEFKKRVSRRKWGGGGLFALGIAVTATSCPFYLISLIGPATIIAGLTFLVLGGAIFLIPPRMQDTTRAIAIALKHGNDLTVTKLALEMDVPLHKAERIVRELVLTGIAEIDLDHKGPDDSLVYRIKGI